MKNFYLLLDPEDMSEKKYAEYTEKIQYAPSIVCPKVKGHYRGGNRLSPLFINIPNNPDDIIWTWYSDCLINDNVAKLLSDYKITGYRLRNINIIKDKRLEKKPELYELEVVGRGGHIHPSSGYKVLEICDACGAQKIQHAKNGLIVDESQWDQSDIFLLDEYPKRMLVNEKLRNLFQHSKIKGCAFKPVEEYKPIG